MAIGNKNAKFVPEINKMKAIGSKNVRFVPGFN